MHNITTAKTALDKFIKDNGEVSSYTAEQMAEFSKLSKAVQSAPVAKVDEKDKADYEALCAEHGIMVSTLFAGFEDVEKRGKKAEGENEGKVVQIVVGLKFKKAGRLHKINAFVSPTEKDLDAVKTSIKVDAAKILSSVE